MKKNIYIIRHGQTDLNILGIVQGRGLDSPLNAMGIRQANAFFENYQEVKFDKIYISSLQRTRQTVQQFIDNGIPYESLEGLDEISWGIYEGKPQNEQILTGFKELTSAWSQGDLDRAVEGGESPRQLQIRQQQAIEHIMTQDHENNVLICMHGRAMRILLAWLSGVGLQEMDRFPHTNTALYQLEYDGVDFKIIDEHNILHLEFLDHV